MLSESLRHQYLTKDWSAFSPAPENCRSLPQAMRDPHPGRHWIGGQVVSVNERSLQLSGQGSLHVFNLGDARLGNYPAHQVLAVGDKVAINTSLKDRLVTELILLSPCRNEPLTLPMSFATTEKWSAFLDAVKTYFEQRGFCRVHTPSLVPCPGTEIHLQPFATEWRMGREHRKMFLPTSPELHLKKMLAAGWTEIFEIAPVFRNEEVSDQHQPQFTMLEWYRAYSGLKEIESDLVGLVQFLIQSGFAVGESGDVERWTVADLIQHVLKEPVGSCASQDEIDNFHQKWVSFIEPWLAKRTGPVLVTDFPEGLAALARTTNGIAERTELYWRGLEIANGYHELNDPEEQLRRIEDDLELRKKLGRTEVPCDETFIAALNSGMPPSGGMAVGLERLFMACQKMEKISALKAFPLNPSRY